MEDITNILAFCGRLGILILFVILAVSGVLRWLGDKGKRAKRLNILSVGAVIVLAVIFLIRNGGTLSAVFGEKNNEAITLIFINGSKIAIKLLVLGAVVASAAMLIFIIWLCIHFGICALKQAKSGQGNSLSEELKNKSNELFAIVRTPIIVFVITWGILALFIVFPLLMSGQDNASLTEAWQEGVVRIVHFVGLDQEDDEASESVPAAAGDKNVGEPTAADGDQNGKEQAAEDTEGETPFYKDLISYILVFIIVLGVGFAVVKILYSIISGTFAKRNEKNIIDEYSAPMGILAVGVSILWTFRSQNIWDNNAITNIGEFVKSFSVVIFVMALAILTLEIIRLLVDMREKLIRYEAKYLFVSLIGQASMLLLEMLHSIYQSVNSAIGGTTKSGMDQIQGKIRRGIVETMDGQLDCEKDYETTFAGFDGEVTKK